MTTNNPDLEEPIIASTLRGLEGSPLSLLEKALLGQILESVVRQEDSGDGADSIVFTLRGGRKYRMYQENDCCENVDIEEIHGDLNDLVGYPILMAEEISSSECDETKTPEAHPAGWVPGEYLDSWTWTFYKFATVRGYVTIRWLGTSNGYYSEHVSFVDITPSANDGGNFSDEGI
jgi:hypothetical protein